MSGTVTKRGPIFDGRAEKALHDAARDAEKTMAERGRSLVDARLSRSLKRQTPYYRTRIAAQELRPGWKVTDQGVIYGHWLEGDGSRNYPRTRFRGYRTFRIVCGQINAQAVLWGKGIVAKYIGRMG